MSSRSLAPLDEHGRTVRTMFDRIAPGYDRANRVMSLGIDARWRARAVGPLCAHVPADRDADVLDLCAGTLDSSIAILQARPNARILAGDFAAEMLAHGETKLTGEARERITTKVMDAHHLDVPDASLDAIFCAFGIRNLSDVPRASAEQRRALRAGGQLCVLEFFRPTRWLTKLVHGVYNQGLLPLVGWAVTGDREAYRYLPRSIGRFYDHAGYAEVLAAAGFVDITFEPLTFGVASIVRARAGNP